MTRVLKPPFRCGFPYRVRFRFQVRASRIVRAAACCLSLFALGLLAATPRRAVSAPPDKTLADKTPAPPITAACFVPDGSGVVIGGQAGIETRGWPGLGAVGRLPTRLEHVHHLAFSPDGRWLAACGGSPAERGEVEFFRWPASDDPPLHVRGGEDVFFQLAWQPGGERWIAAGGDGRLFRGRLGADHVGADREWKDRPLETFRGHSRRVLTVAATDAVVFSGGADRSLRVWQWEPWEAVRTLSNHTGDVRDLAVRPRSADGGLRMLASAGADRTVRFWQPEIGRLVRFARLPSPPLDIDWLPDGSQLVAACADGRVRVIDPETVRVRHELRGIDGWAYTLVAAPDGRSVLVGGEGGAVRQVTLPGV